MSALDEKIADLEHQLEVLYMQRRGAPVEDEPELIWCPRCGADIVDEEEYDDGIAVCDSCGDFVGEDDA